MERAWYVPLSCACNGRVLFLEGVRCRCGMRGVQKTTDRETERIRITQVNLQKKGKSGMSVHSIPVIVLLISRTSNWSKIRFSQPAGRPNVSFFCRTISTASGGSEATGMRWLAELKNCAAGGQDAGWVSVLQWLLLKLLRQVDNLMYRNLLRHWASKADATQTKKKIGNKQVDLEWREETRWGLRSGNKSSYRSGILRGRRAITRATTKKITKQE